MAQVQEEEKHDASQRALETTRSLFEERRGSIRCFRGYWRFRGETYAFADHNLVQIYKYSNAFLNEGKIVWGCIVQANNGLYRCFTVPMYYDLPAVLVYSLDPYYDSKVNELRALANLLFDSKFGPSIESDGTFRLPPPEMQAVAEALRAEKEYFLKIAVPTSLTQGHQVYLTTTVVHRRHLPRPWFLKNDCLPLLVAPNHTDAAKVLPANLWSNEMRKWWKILKD